MKKFLLVAALVAAPCFAQKVQYQYGQQQVDVHDNRGGPIGDGRPSYRTLEKLEKERQDAETTRAIIWAAAIVAAAIIVGVSLVVRGKTNGDAVHDSRRTGQGPQEDRRAGAGGD